MDYGSTSTLAAIDAEMAALSSITASAPLMSARRQPLQPSVDASPPQVRHAPATPPPVTLRSASARSASVPAPLDTSTTDGAARRRMNDILATVGMSPGGADTGSPSRDSTSPVSLTRVTLASEARSASASGSALGVSALPAGASGRGRVFDEASAQQRTEIAELRRALLSATQAVHKAQSDAATAKAEAKAANAETQELRRALGQLRDTIVQRDRAVEDDRRRATENATRTLDEARKTAHERLTREQQARQRAEGQLRRTESAKAAALSAAAKHEARANAAEATARRRGRALQELVQFVRGPLRRLVKDSAPVLQQFGSNDNALGDVGAAPSSALRGSTGGASVHSSVGRAAGRGFSTDAYSPTPLPDPFAYTPGRPEIYTPSSVLRTSPPRDPLLDDDDEGDSIIAATAGMLDGNDDLDE